jgi:hypothetical protein
LIKINDSGQTINEKLFQCLFVIIGTVKDGIGRFCPSLFETISEIFMDKHH